MSSPAMLEPHGTDFYDNGERTCADCGAVRLRDEMTTNYRGDFICWDCPCKVCGDELLSRDECETGVCDPCYVDALEAAEACLAGVA